MKIISITSEPHEVKDYDFTFSNGLFMSMTVDDVQGDTIDIGQTHAIIHLSMKPSVTDPNVLSPAEDVTIFMPHVLSLQVRTRMTNPATPEQRADMQDTIFQLSNTTH